MLAACSRFICCSMRTAMAANRYASDSRACPHKEVIAWQLTQAMQEQSLSKTRMAAMLQTSRSQLDRLLDPTSDVTLSTLERAAALVGRKLSITLV